MGLPWRYALACMDQTLPYVREQFLDGLLSDVLDGIVTHDQARRQLAEFDASPKSRGLGLILRRDIIWSKPNGLPESVTDRCRSSHEYLFHFTVRPRYYAAVDEIREPHARIYTARDYETYVARANKRPGTQGFTGGNGTLGDNPGPNPLGKLPGSVWAMPSQPLLVPESLGISHFAAFPMELPRRCVLGWSPPGICVECGEGRRPIVDKALLAESERRYVRAGRIDAGRDGKEGYFGLGGMKGSTEATITGYACGCTPYTDHPGTGERHRNGDHPSGGNAGANVNAGTRLGDLGSAERVGPWREYHLDGWTPPPARPALVVDPFGGTGTTALVASMLGRTGVSVDLSADYCSLARWRTQDPAERAKALLVPKPPPVPDGQASLFDDLEAS